MMCLSIFTPQVAFDGWATALIVFILGSKVTYKTYKYVTKSKFSQKQKAGTNSNQEQSIRSTSLKDKNTISQSQEAGNNSKQKQTI